MVRDFQHAAWAMIEMSGSILTSTSAVAASAPQAAQQEPRGDGSIPGLQMPVLSSDEARFLAHQLIRLRQADLTPKDLSALDGEGEQAVEDVVHEADMLAEK